MQDMKTVRIVNNKVQPRGDLEMTLNSNGTFREGPAFISGPDKIVQDVVRGLLTQIGTMLLAPNFGTSLPSLLGARNLEGVASDITSQIQYMLGYLAQFNINEPTDEQIATLVRLAAKDNLGTIELVLDLSLVSGQSVGVTI